MRSLRPYQIEAVRRIRHAKATALYMEMRLGKTLCVIRALPKYGRYLVVAPMAGLWAWKRELNIEGVKSISVLTGTPLQRLETLDQANTWNLINYEGVRCVPKIMHGFWNAVILDECRRIANPQAKTTKTLLKWSANSDGTKRIILSGNPAPESPLEYFEQMRFLYGKFMGCENYWQFRNYYFRELAPHEWVPKPNATTKIKEAVHASAYILTRKEAGLESTKIYERRTVLLKSATRRAYEKIRSDFVAEWKGRELASTKWVPVQYTWLQQLASGHLGRKLCDKGKVTTLVELLGGELKDEQVVVWFRFNSGIQVVKKAFRKEGVSYGVIKGSVSVEDREGAINRFRAGRSRILLCQIRCAREAIDLSNSSTAIYYSNSHSLDDRSQSEDRILNPAKKEPLLYIDLVAEDTVDEDIVDLLREKKVESRFFLTHLLEKLNVRKEARRLVQAKA